MRKFKTRGDHSKERKMGTNN